MEYFSQTPVPITSVQHQRKEMKRLDSIIHLTYREVWNISVTVYYAASWSCSISLWALSEIDFFRCHKRFVYINDIYIYIVKSYYMQIFTLIVIRIRLDFTSCIHIIQLVTLALVVLAYHYKLQSKHLLMFSPPLCWIGKHKMN